MIAHRTCPRNAPENSLAGIRFAAESGADAVEIDVRLTSDGHPVLMHDRWLWRTTGRPRRVHRTTLSVVRRLRLRGGSGTVPTLTEALEALAPGLKVAIDVKDPAAAGAVIDEVRRLGLEDRALFWGQSKEAVALASETAPEIEASLLRDAISPSDRRLFLDDAVASRARGISAHWSVIEPGFVGEARDRGLLVYAWCKTESIDPGKVGLIDGLVTDWPARGRAVVADLG